MQPELCFSFYLCQKCIKRRRLVTGIQKHLQLTVDGLFTVLSKRRKADILLSATKRNVSCTQLPECLCLLFKATQLRNNSVTSCCLTCLSQVLHYFRHGSGLCFIYLFIFCFFASLFIPVFPAYTQLHQLTWPRPC